MAENGKNNKGTGSEAIPFSISEFSSLKYIKIIFVDSRNELTEIRAETHSITEGKIQLDLSGKKNFNMSCPTGVVLKFVISDGIYFAKTILRDIKYENDKYILTIDTPQKTIRQQKRQFYRIDMNRNGILRINNENGNSPVYITQTLNISKGGVLLGDVEEIDSDKKVILRLPKDTSCNIVLFLEHDFVIKISAKLVRAEEVNGSYKYGLQFFNVPMKYIAPFEKYMTSEELKALKTEL